MRRTTTITIILVLFVLPIILLRADVVPIGQRHWVLVAVIVVAALVARGARWSWRDLGVRSDNLQAGFAPYLAYAVVGAIVAVAFALAVGRVPRPNWWLQPHFQGLLLPISIAQEFLYRSVLIPLLQRIHRAPWFVIIVNATLFALLHLIFPDPSLVFPLTFLGGLVFTALWLRWPNLWLASAAHVALNATFVLFCFGSFDGSCVAR